MNVNLNPFPALQTDRLILRQLDMNDREELFRLRRDDSINKYLNRPKATRIEEAERFIKLIELNTKNNIGAYWVISLKSSRALIGTICYWNLDFEKSIAEIGYELDVACQGQGIMWEAMKKVIEYGFDTMHIKVITALPYESNESSLRLLKRAGFKKDPDFKYTDKEETAGQAVYILIKDNNK